MRLVEDGSNDPDIEMLWLVLAKMVVKGASEFDGVAEEGNVGEIETMVDLGNVTSGVVVVI